MNNIDEYRLTCSIKINPDSGEKEYRKLKLQRYSQGKMIEERDVIIAEGVHLKPWTDLNVYMEDTLRKFVEAD